MVDATPSAARSLDTRSLGGWLGVAAVLHGVLFACVSLQGASELPVAAQEPVIWLENGEDEARGERAAESSTGGAETSEEAGSAAPTSLTPRPVVRAALPSSSALEDAGASLSAETDRDEAAPDVPANDALPTAVAANAVLASPASADAVAAPSDAPSADAPSSFASPKAQRDPIVRDERAVHGALGSATTVASKGGASSRNAALARGASPRGAGRGAIRRGLAATLAHGPRLRVAADPCRGMFPRGAEHDEGSVVVALRVTPSGVPTGPRVLEEFPRGEGFAEAARACLPRLRFEPAADAEGVPVAAESVVRLRFHRG